jgi:DnaJ-class molecular chaperone
LRRTRKKGEIRMASKCEECQGSGWAYGKEEFHDIECSTCNGAGWVYQSDLTWAQVFRDANRAGAASNPPYKVEPYKNGRGIKKLIWVK